MTRIALLGPYASRNLGDTATQLTVLAELRRRRPLAEIVGVSHEPDDALASLGIPAFPLRGFGKASGALAAEFPCAVPEPRAGRLTRLLAHRRIDAFVRRLSLLVISGGGQLDDFWGGPWDHPWLLCAWTALARRHGVPVAYLAVGVDHLRSPISRQLVAWGTRLAQHRSFRDAGSLATLRSLGLRGPAMQCPDVVFGMHDPARGSPPPARPFAVINPITRRTWSDGDDARHAAYLAGLEALGAWLADRGLTIRIACSQRAMDGADAERLAAALRARGVPAPEVAETPTVDRYLDTVRGADLVIASRFHGVILSLVTGSPVVALAPLPKVERVMAEFGLERLCLPLQRFDATELVARASSALADATLRARIAATVERHRASLAAVYDDLEALLGPAAPTVRAAAGSAR